MVLTKSSPVGAVGSSKHSREGGLVYPQAHPRCGDGISCSLLTNRATASIFTGATAVPAKTTAAGGMTAAAALDGRATTNARSTPFLTNAPLPQKENDAPKPGVSVLDSYSYRQLKTMDPSTGERLMIAELNQMTLEDRNHMYEDIHGVAPDLDESPEILRTKFQLMQDRIDKIRTKKAYTQAHFMNPRYTNDRKLRLMFLRSTYMEPDKAAKNFVAFFEFKLQLWGVDKLARNIVYADLSKEDREVYMSGCCQFFPDTKDSMGRALYYGIFTEIVFRNNDNYLRAIWYAIMQAMHRSEVAQSKGVVGCCYCVNLDDYRHLVTMEFLIDAPKLKNVLPIRYAVLHSCSTDSTLMRASALILLAFERSTRVRYRSHFGTHQECLYHLLSFGVPPQSFPVNQHGEIMKESFQRKAERFIANEVHSPRTIARIACEQGENKEDDRSTEEVAGIDFPTSLDVVLGKGRPFQDWPGNIELTNLIDTHYRPIYAQKGSDQRAKYAVTIDVIRHIHSTGGRFLRRVPASLDEASGAQASRMPVENTASLPSLWEVVDDKAARLKISHLLRAKARNSSNSMATKPATAKPKRSNTKSAKPTAQPVATRAAQNPPVDAPMSDGTLAQDHVDPIEYVEGTGEPLTMDEINFLLGESKDFLTC